MWSMSLEVLSTPATTYQQHNFGLEGMVGLSVVGLHPLVSTHVLFGKCQTLGLLPRSVTCVTRVVVK